MKTIKGFDELKEMAKDGFFVRWSRGPEVDEQMGNSLDQVSGQRHNGISCQEITDELPSTTIAQMIVEYRFLRRKDSEIFAWVCKAERTGTDSDGAALIDANTIKDASRIDESLIESLTQYTNDWWTHRNNPPTTWNEQQEWMNSYPKLSDYI